MSGSNPFPYLLKLLGDPSEVVQTEVRNALLPMAPRLGELLGSSDATSEQRFEATRLLYAWRKARLLKAWPSWNAEADPVDQLEQAHSLLSEFHGGWTEPAPLAERLHRLAADFRGSGERLDEAVLTAWLFRARFRGDTETYDSPENSFLGAVLGRHCGNPITLCSLLILVGKRCDLSFWGCNYPGHFLARFAGSDGPCYVDCFDGGRLLGPELEPRLRANLTAGETERLLRQPVSSAEIVARMLRNLISAYLHREARPEANLFTLLSKDLSAREAGLGAGAGLREPLFFPGQLVQHKAKGYRGVVVDYDLYLSQDDATTHQPTYRVLVHGSPHVASALEDQLGGDDGGLVAHPYVSIFFSRFEDGVYLRNSRPWGT